MATGYTGTVTFSSSDSDPMVWLPSPYTFVAGNAGEHTFPFKLVTAGVQSITATDAANLLVSESNITVQPGATAGFQLASFPSTATAGVSSNFTLTAIDSFGNRTPGYTGTVNFTSTDPKATLPAAYTFLSGDAGTHIFPATLFTAGTRNLKATDSVNSSFSGTESNIKVVAATVASLSVSGMPNPDIAGVSHLLTISADDAYGNVATGYTGTVQLTTSDSQVTWPAYTLIKPQTLEQLSLWATLKSAGVQWIKATDINNSSLIGTESNITVVPGATAGFQLTGFPSTVTAGVPSNFTLTAIDACGNSTPGYTGTVNFTSTDPKATLPAAYTFLSGDAGTHIFPATLFTAGTRNLKATDSVNSSFSGTESNIKVVAATVASLSVSGMPNPDIAGVSHLLTISADDAYGNVATGYTGTVQLTTSDSQVTWPAYTLTAANAGTLSLWATLKSAGVQWIKATDINNSSLIGTESNITVVPGATAGFQLTGFPSTVTAGVPSNFTLTAIDACGNSTPGYTGTVNFTSTDPKATLPAAYTFLSGDAGTHIFPATLFTAGTRNLKATDSVNSSFSGTESNIKVVAATVASLSVSGMPNPDIAGVSHLLSISADDAYGNVATDTPHSPAHHERPATWPAYTLTAANAGTLSLWATLKSAGVQWIKATDINNSSLIGTESNITVVPGATAGFQLTGFPSTVTAGVPSIFTLIAIDACGNSTPGYTGTVNFTSTDPKATLPAAYTFLSGDAGTHIFPATLFTAGTRNLKATDSVNSSFSGTESNITVVAAAAASLSVSGMPSPEIAGVPHTLTITAYDAFGKVATGYTGTVELSSSDSQVPWQGAYSFTAANAGVLNLTAGLMAAGVQWIKATDLSNSSLTGTESNITVVPGATAGFQLTGFPSTVTAGVPSNFTLTAIDACGNVATGYTGTVTLSSSDSKAVLASPYSFGAGDAGKHTFSVTLETAGTQSITATDAANLTGNEPNILVKPAAASTLSVTGFPTSDTAGAAGTIIVTAYDPYGNLATGYTGTVTLSSSDPSAMLPSPYTFVAGDAGKHTFPVTLQTAGRQSITATDNSNLTGTESNIAVLANAQSMTVTGFPNTTTAGVSHNVTVTVYNSQGNVATGYTGTVQLTSNDPNAILPEYKFTAADAGTHTFSVALVTVGTWNLTATDTTTSSLTGSESNITVNAAGASSFAVSAFPSPDTAGVSHNLTVTAYDAFGNVATGYTGTVQFSSSDPKAVLPSATTFTSGNHGTIQVAATLKTAGVRSISATDNGHSSIEGTESNIVVQSAAPTSISLSGFPTTATAGVSSSFTVTALDAYGNVATGYTGTVNFTSTDPKATLPASYTFLSGDAGSHTFAATLFSAGTRSLKATDSVNSSISGTESNIKVVAAGAQSLSISGMPSPEIAGAGHTMTITAYDAFGNVATGYTGTVQVTTSDTQVTSLTYTLTAANAGTFNQYYGLKTAGVQWIKATDLSNSSLTATESNITVQPGATAGFQLIGVPSTITAGVSSSFTLTAIDTCGNRTPSYTGTVNFTSTDPKATLPASYTFVAGDAGSQSFPATLFTAGTRSLKATDSVSSSISGTESNIKVVAATAVSLSVSGIPNPEIAGVWHILTISAVDAYGNVATGYTGTIQLTTSDSQVTWPGTYTLTAANAGTLNLAAVLKAAGVQWIKATDINNSSLTGTESNITVQPGATAGFQLASFPSTATAGVSSNFTLTAIDSFGNRTPGYTGTVNFTSTDPKATLPASYTFLSGDAGTHIFAATLFTAGTRSLKATDSVNSSFSGTESNIKVVAATAVSLSVSGMPNPDIAGIWHLLTISADDAYGNVATGYTGTVQLTTSDSQVTWSGTNTFTAANAGTLNLPAVLKTAGVQSITATDINNSSLTATESNITVQPGAAVSFKVTGFPNPDSAGVAHSVTVTAYDAFGNVATGYLGTVNFSSTESAAGLPASYTFLASDNGSHVFSITLNTKGTRSITVTDSTDNVSGSETGIIVQ